jgi:DNA-binding MarR family transcriptional regulator
LMEPSRVGPWVLDRRAAMLAPLAAAVDRGRLAAKAGQDPLPLAAELVVGAVVNVLQTRMTERRGASPSMYELLNPLMANIVLAYLGPAAARRELAAPTAPPRRVRRNGSVVAGNALVRDPLAGLPMRLTYRTLRTLSALAETPGASNRVAADAAGVSDQGQISKLLTRLEGLGLIENVAKGRPLGEANAWRLTPRGEEVERAVRMP